MTVGTSASAGLAVRFLLSPPLSPFLPVLSCSFMQSTALSRSKTLPNVITEFDDLPPSAFSIPSHFSSSPALPRPAPPLPAVDPKGKGKRRALYDPDEFAMEEEDMVETQPADDPWADILGEATPAKEKGKGKGKKKDEEEEGGKKKGKKRALDEGSGSEGEGGSIAKRTAKEKVRLFPSFLFFPLISPHLPPHRLLDFPPNRQVSPNHLSLPPSRRQP
jgi:hypothetical protein